MANIALLDPGITLGMPPALTAATGMDAITHGIEAYVANENTTRLLRGFAFAGTQKC